MWGIEPPQVQPLMTTTPLNGLSKCKKYFKTKCTATCTEYMDASFIWVGNNMSRFMSNIFILLYSFFYPYKNSFWISFSNIKNHWHWQIHKYKRIVWKDGYHLIHVFLYNIYLYPDQVGFIPKDTFLDCIVSIFESKGILVHFWFFIYSSTLQKTWTPLLYKNVLRG